MTVHFEIPTQIEKSLVEQFGDVNQAVKQAALVELYRQDKLTHHELSLALGLSRLATETVLKAHGVTEDLITPEEYDAALSHLRTMMP